MLFSCFTTAGEIYAVSLRDEKYGWTKKVWPWAENSLRDEFPPW